MWVVAVLVVGVGVSDAPMVVKSALVGPGGGFGASSGIG